MKLILAPMQGLTDVHMRDLLTRIAGADGYDWCVSEFMRVTDRLLPARTIYQLCPELLTGSRTAAGTPVHVQLLGSEPAVLAENAVRVAELGAAGIDLNFGCPAKTVNFHRGGAILLDEPETVHAIVAAVRRAVPAGIPVSAKMRLGVNDRSRMLDNAQGIDAAGASWLTVHGRTKADGYRPPAYWDAIGEIREAVQLNVIANGDIVGEAEAEACRQQSGCEDLMLGRGAVTRPDLVCRLKGIELTLDWPRLLELQLEFLGQMRLASEHPVLADGVSKWTEGGAVGRYKQWLGMLTLGYAEAVPLFDRVKRLKGLEEIRCILQAEFQNSQASGL
jgi:tRNA-dihydrouridine synthase C